MDVCKQFNEVIERPLSSAKLPIDRKAGDIALRFPENPLITPKDITMGEGLSTVGTFNPGVTVYRGETLLLVRVAVRSDSDGDTLRIPVMQSGIMTYMSLPKCEYDCSDSRVVTGKGGRFLTSMSCFVVATSRDGRRFTVHPERRILPEGEEECFGIEDPRITEIDGTYYITYSAVSPWGITTGLRKTRDFVTFEKCGTILHPDNKDSVIFPERIGGKYYMLHRPSTLEFGKPEVWIATSDNLVHWGEHKRIFGVRKGKWDSERIGSSGVPFRTEKGWLIVYHGVDETGQYGLGAALLDADNPAKVLARSEKPFLRPLAPYERVGFFGNVVFACGGRLDGDTLTVYYGAADESIGGATVSVRAIMEDLR